MKTQFMVSINIENAAFDPDPRVEVCRLLREIVATLEAKDTTFRGILRDLNGNSCGVWNLPSPHTGPSQPTHGNRMTRPRYYDRQGNPITMEEWAALMEADLRGEYRIVCRTDLPDGSWLSTVWLGLDHSFAVMWMSNEPPPPLIFETMRFGDTMGGEDFPDPEDGEPTSQVRYSTEADAREGHARILALLEQQSEHKKEAEHGNKEDDG